MIIFTVEVVCVDTPSSSFLSTNNIIGIAVSSVVAGISVIITRIAVVICCCVLRKKGSQQRSNDNDESYTGEK